MRNAFWQPREERTQQEHRPYLEAPSPYMMPLEPPRETEPEEESPRVIIIDI